MGSGTVRSLNHHSPPDCIEVTGSEVISRKPVNTERNMGIWWEKRNERRRRLNKEERNKWKKKLVEEERKVGGEEKLKTWAKGTSMFLRGFTLLVAMNFIISLLLVVTVVLQHQPTYNNSSATTQDDIQWNLLTIDNESVMHVA